jgi:hypothetical protein
MTTFYCQLGKHYRDVSEKAPGRKPQNRRCKTCEARLEADRVKHLKASSKNRSKLNRQQKRYANGKAGKFFDEIFNNK